MQFWLQFQFWLWTLWQLEPFPCPRWIWLCSFELFAQGVTWSYKSQLIWAGEGCLDFICLHLLG